MFGNLGDKPKCLQTYITALEQQLQVSYADNIHEQWDNKKWELQQVEAWENERLCYRMKEGDKNTKFFHMMIRERHQKQTIQIRLQDGTTTRDAKEIGELAELYFSKLFSASPYFLDEGLFSNITPIISDLENLEFCQLPSMEEIWEATQALNPNSAPSSDGFSGHFYTKCWTIIKADLNDMIDDYFKGGYLTQEITDTKLVLVPKKRDARMIEDFRPISLCNFSGKIISRILATRMAKLLSKLVDKEQAGFIKGRNITAHIALAQELVKDLKRKATGGNICLKLDMAKAYDRLEWRFLLRTMTTFGFSEIAKDLIFRNICSIKYYLL